MSDDKLTELFDQTFYKYAHAKVENLKQVRRSFVHYTSVEAAISIIRNKEIWLRNSRVMNDYSEIAHGEQCVRHCLMDDQVMAERSKAVLDGLADGLYDRTIRWFLDFMAHRVNFTYLLSISEHGPETIQPGTVDEESYFGRLSMWRAYGSSGGVALIFDHDAITDEREVLPVYSSPVFYGNPGEFSALYGNMLGQLERNAEQFKQIDPELLWENLARSLHFAILACKHPGFREEREWRITFSADPGNEDISDEDFNANNLIQREFRAVNGIPQRIYKIPLKNFGAEIGHDISLPRILKKLVIGPTAFPSVVNDALVLEMLKSGFTPEQIRISLSDIPMRL